MLASAGIPHRLEPTGAVWTLSVPEGEMDHARETLDSFDAEETPPARHAVTTDRPVPWFLGTVVGALLLAGFAVTGSPVASPRWFERGAAIAGLMRAEPWRAVTALTLHLDVAHVVGNAVATAILLPAVAQRLGAGVALLLTLLAGATGNVLAAMAHAPGHAAVGASTATFAAVGMLGALRLLSGFAGEPMRWKSWMVPAASLLLLVLLGASRGADVLAHVMGFVSGAAVGLGAAVIRQPFGPLVQWTLGALTAVIVAGCWLRAV